MGILFLSYDLAPFFVLPLLAVLMLRRKWSWVVLAVMIALAPSIQVVLVLRFGARLELYNENTAPYFVILRRYFDHYVTFRAWMAHISVWPRELIKTYFWSNFVFLPALFVVVAVMQLFVRQTREARAEWGVLLSGLVLFLFNNCAPPYRGWQFHGEGVSRIYQPVVGAMMLILVRAFGEDCSLPAAALSLRNFAASRAMVALLGVTCVLNASVVLGPVTLNPMAAWIDHKFYQHAPAPQMLSNLAIYGRRPLGFCNQLIPAKPRKRRATTRATAATVPSTTSIAPAPSPGG
jgi:hypothetical protein